MKAHLGWKQLKWQHCKLTSKCGEERHAWGFMMTICTQPDHHTCLCRKDKFTCANLLFEFDNSLGSCSRVGHTSARPLTKCLDWHPRSHSERLAAQDLCQRGSCNQDKMAAEQNPVPLLLLKHHFKSTPCFFSHQSWVILQCRPLECLWSLRITIPFA